MHNEGSHIAGGGVRLPCERFGGFRCRWRRCRSSKGLLAEFLMTDLVAELALLVLALRLPAVFDLLAIGLSRTGLLFVPASIWQIMRGPGIIFAEIIGVLLLGAPVYAYRWRRPPEPAIPGSSPGRVT